MNRDDDDNVVNNGGDEDGRPAPVFVLPGAGSATSQGMGAGAGMSTGSPIIPEPFVSRDAEDGSTAGGLADRIERVLADDGRFAPLLPALVIEDNGGGHVALSGRITDPAIRASLLATIHAVPGVADVKDNTG